MRKILTSVLILLVFSFFTYSQGSDFQSWTNLKISKKVYKRTNIIIKQAIRFRENSTLISKNFTDLKLSYKIKKTDLLLSLGYRFIDEVDLDGSSDLQNRYFLDFSSAYKYKRYKLSIRERIQYQGNYSDYKALFRQKFNVSYNVRKTPFRPFLQFEYFINFDDEFEKLRYTLGFSHPLLKDLDVDLFYRVQQMFNVSNLQNLYIFGTSLSYKL